MKTLTKKQRAKIYFEAAQVAEINGHFRQPYTPLQLAYSNIIGGWRSIAAIEKQFPEICWGAWQTMENESVILALLLSAEMCNEK